MPLFTLVILSSKYNSNYLANGTKIIIIIHYHNVPVYFVYFLLFIDESFCSLIVSPLPSLAPLSSNQNTIEIIGLGVINILLLLFAVIQVFQSTKWRNRVNSQLDKDRQTYLLTNLPIELPKTVIGMEVVLVLVLLVFAAASVYLGYRLYRQFGWNIYKKIGANIQMQSKWKIKHDITINQVV